MYRIDKSRLAELFAAISGNQDLFLPLRKADQTNYGLWSEEECFDLDTLKTVKVCQGLLLSPERGALPL